MGKTDLSRRKDDHLNIVLDRRSSEYGVDATLSIAAAVEPFDVVIRQLRIACFCTGSADLHRSRQARTLKSDYLHASRP